MRMSWLAAGLLVAVGVGAIGLVVLQPGAGGQSSAQYLTSTATVTNVVDEAVATGTVSATATYGLAFGSTAQKVTSTSSGTGSSGTGGSSGGSSSWQVTAVNVSVGQKVRTGEVLATADTADAAAQLAVAHANLATAQARLAEDKAGATSAAKAQASAQVTQAEQQVTQAKQNQTYAKQQNDLAVKQGQAAVDRAKAQLAADKAAGAPANVLAQDQAAITSASDALASTKLRVAQSNAQAANSVKSAQLSLAGAKTSYAAQTAPATDAQLASDQAAVLTAESAVRASQATLDGAVLRAPVDGLVVAVDVEPGMTAPSGYAIQVQAMSMEVVASFAEADLPSLAVGQPATVTLTATDKTADGKVTRITPVASASSGGSGGVVTYEVAVAITQVPDGTLAGMTADIGVTTAEADGVVAVPAIALTGSAGNYAVRVVDSSGATETRSVEVGLTSSSLAEIRSGVQAGETVVIGTTSTRNTTTTTLGGGGGIAIPGGGFPGGGFRP